MSCTLYLFLDYFSAQQSSLSINFNMPVDHFTLTVPRAKLDEVVTFLTTSLAHLGFHEIVRPIPTVVGMGETKPYFWLNTVNLEGDEAKGFEAGLKAQHIAFSAKNSEEVRQFHAAALKIGATCNGAPGLRPHYHPGYYGAFVLDPACGINFEVVFHGGE